jgi:uncharacterized protein YndB with AHSA1/START domain
MPSILHDFFINAPAKKVFACISSPNGLDQWWTKHSSAEQVLGGVYELWFGPEYDWRGKVTKLNPNTDFELEIFNADKDWNGTLVGFHLEEKDGAAIIRFYHKNWHEENEHFRISSYCWAMYLRILKRYLEHGETVPYEDRLDV